MSREQRESGKRWIDEQLVMLFEAEGVAGVDTRWRIGLDGTHWVEVHTAHATLREGFRAADLERLATDVALKGQIENRLAAAVSQIRPS